MSDWPCAIRMKWHGHHLDKTPGRPFPGTPLQVYRVRAQSHQFMSLQQNVSHLTRGEKTQTLILKVAAIRGATHSTSLTALCKNKYIHNSMMSYYHVSPYFICTIQQTQCCPMKFSGYRGVKGPCLSWVSAAETPSPWYARSVGLASHGCQAEDFWLI